MGGPIEDLGHYIANFLGAGLVSVIYAILWGVFGIWRGIVWCIEILEDIFRFFVGMGGSDPAEALIKDPAVQGFFLAIAGIAASLLVFFTILQIIRENYTPNDKTGTIDPNPYIVVFRMFKGMFVLAFLPLAVTAGFMMAGVVLSEMNNAFHKGKGYERGMFTGMVFNSMAHGGNRIRLGFPNNRGKLTHGNEPYFEMGIFDREEQKMLDRIMVSAGEMKPSLAAENGKVHYKAELSSSVGAGQNNNQIRNKYFPHLVPFVDSGVSITSYEFIWEEFIGGSTPWKGYTVTKTPLKAENVPNMKIWYNGRENGGTSPNTPLYYPGMSWSAQPPAGGGTVDDKQAQNWLEVLVARALLFEKAVELFDRSKLGGRITASILDSLAFDAGGWVKSFSPNSEKADEVDRFVVYVPIINDKSTLLSKTFFIENLQKFIMNESDILDINISAGSFPWINATKIDAIFSREDKTKWYIKETKDGGKTWGIVGWFDTPADFHNWRAVRVFYDVNEFNFLIGFAGAMIIAGVFLNFTFALIHRIGELVVMFCVAPIPLAFYPIDNGVQFMKQFVKPFYQKIITVFALVLSMNLFFTVIYPAVNGVDGSGSGPKEGSWIKKIQDQGRAEGSDYVQDGARWLLLQFFITIGLFTMLPKLRKSIEMVMGAEELKEAKPGETYKAAKEQVPGLAQATGLAAAGGMALRNKAMTSAPAAAIRGGVSGAIAGAKNAGGAVANRAAQAMGFGSTTTNKDGSLNRMGRNKEARKVQQEEMALAQLNSMKGNMSPDQRRDHARLTQNAQKRDARYEELLIKQDASTRGGAAFTKDDEAEMKRNEEFYKAQHNGDPKKARY